MQTLNTVGSILKSKMKEKMREDSQLHFMYFSFESKCKYMEESAEFVYDSPHVHNEVDNVW